MINKASSATELNEILNEENIIADLELLDPLANVGNGLCDNCVIANWIKQNVTDEIKYISVGTTALFADDAQGRFKIKFTPILSKLSQANSRGDMINAETAIKILKGEIA